MTKLPPVTAQLDRSIVLVGLMGAGKTSVGRRLAQHLGLPFVDADHEIEAAAGCTIEEIFLAYGEAEFREGERRVMKRLLEGPPIVLATGGGAFMDAGTRAQIEQHGLSIWLRAELDVLLRRVLRRNDRPLLKQGDPREILKKLIAQRYPVYEQADIIVDSSDGPHEAVVEQIEKQLRIFLDRSLTAQPQGGAR
jgi:shikimate kinase